MCMSIDISKKPFVFIFQLEIKSSVTARIIVLLFERNVEVVEFYYYVKETNEGRLFIYCQMEKDRIGRTVYLLDKLPGVLNIDWMESKRRNTRV